MEETIQDLVASVPRPQASWFRRPDGSNAAYGIHGLGHATRVLLLVNLICDELDVDPWEREAAQLAAIWHDIGRIHDGGDYYHGGRSAGKVVGIGLDKGIDPIIVEIALHAVANHCGSETHGEEGCRWLCDPDSGLKVFRILKDADGLDRVRLGGLDTRFLRFNVSHGLVDMAWALLREVTV